MDERLLSTLAEIASRADASGEADVRDISSAEYRELKRLGMFDEVSEYMDATARQAVVRRPARRRGVRDGRGRRWRRRGESRGQGRERARLLLRGRG